MKVVWDLDGVLRDLSGHISRKHNCPYPKKWNETFNGKSFYDCVKEDTDILLKAAPTAYLPVMLRHQKTVEIWTAQPPQWQGISLQWIETYITRPLEIVFLKPEEKVVKLATLKDTVLIEDNPNLSSYTNIILIDRPYNQEVKQVMRVYGPKHLDNLLELFQSN